jgi:hypothetical protein
VSLDGRHSWQNQISETHAAIVTASSGSGRPSVANRVARPHRPSPSRPASFALLKSAGVRTDARLPQWGSPDRRPDAHSPDLLSSSHARSSRLQSLELALLSGIEDSWICRPFSSRQWRISA